MLIWESESRRLQCTEFDIICRFRSLFCSFTSKLIFFAERFQELHLSDFDGGAPVHHPVDSQRKAHASLGTITKSAFCLDSRC